MHSRNLHIQYPAIVIDWEADALTVVEGASNVSLCTSIANPDLMNLRQAVQLQVFTLSSTAQGRLATLKIINADHYLLLILNDSMKNLRTISQSHKI